MQKWAGIRGVKRLKTGQGRVSREGNLKEREGGVISVSE